MILISGYSGKGKTTSIMLLLSAIARDKELYWVFSELQNHIIYFDSVNDKSALLNYLGNTGKQKCKLIIVDNIQKYTISSRYLLNTDFSSLFENEISKSLYFSAKVKSANYIPLPGDW